MNELIVWIKPTGTAPWIKQPQKSQIDLFLPRQTRTKRVFKDALLVS